MVRETELFFEEILKRDLPVQNFISAGFPMLNARLAGHYGIAGVSGPEFAGSLCRPTRTAVE